MSRFPRPLAGCFHRLRVSAAAWAVALTPVLVLAVFPESALARTTTASPVWSQAPRADHLPGAFGSDFQSSDTRSARSDTLSFGSVDTDGFAILGQLWTWDHGGTDPLEGWSSDDLTTQNSPYFRQITATSWTTGTNNAVSAPLLSGAGSAWLGAFEIEADALCWESGLGYGNAWRQWLVSPVLEYTGSGNVTLQFEYFTDSELNFDYTRILLRRVDEGQDLPILDPGFTGEIGLATDHPASPPIGATRSLEIEPWLFGTSDQFQIVFEFTSDGGWSDEDGAYETAYGPFGLDDVSVSGNVSGGPFAYSFETGLQGWTPAVPPGFGSHLGVAPLADYDLENACQCALSGNILEMHDDNGEHPDGQRVFAVSNPVDVLNDVTPFLGGPGGNLSISAAWDQYSNLPRPNGVFYRPGWQYYPFVCPVTGDVGWSERVGQSSYFYAGNDPVCARNADSATASGIPGTGVEQIRFVYELYSSCDGFPLDCTGETNETPLLDNVEIAFTRLPLAPGIAFGIGARYQDGFAQTKFLDPNGVGRADVVQTTNLGSEPWVLGDSLHISGPFSTPSTRWEARLWFRINREGPGTKPPAYNSWKTGIADGRNITGGEFTFAWMDSFQVGTNVSKNKFVSYLRESDDDFNSGAGELSDLNEIIRDNVLIAGSAIEYFVTSNFTATPSENFLLPDTSGGFFNEFAILPNWEHVDGVFKFPCFLYVDISNPSSASLGAPQVFVGSALDALGIPYDRYDYLDSASSWKAPMARGASPSNNGVPLEQLLGYRVILANTGRLGAGFGRPEDWVLLTDWLTAVHCEGLQRRGLIVNGDSPGEALATMPAVLNLLGADLQTGAYNFDAGDENFCVRLGAPLGAAYGTTNSLGAYDYDAYGNWCPLQYSFDVLDPVGTGVGNRSFINTDTFDQTNYAQIVNSVSGAGNYRTVLDGVSYDHLALRGSEECASEFDNIAGAVKNEIASALEWILDGDLPGLCEIPCVTTPTDAPDVTGLATGTTRLYASAPNPFHPRTTLRFSLAGAGRAHLAIFDASGRNVRTLADGPHEAGLHEIVWDGSDAAGKALPAGVYWSQLTTEGYTSSKKMVLLK